MVFGTENGFILGMTRDWSSLTKFDQGFYLAMIIWQNDFGSRDDVKPWFWMEFDKFDPRLTFCKLWSKFWISRNLLSIFNQNKPLTRKRDRL